YRVAIPLSTFLVLPPEGETCALEVHTLVRDDAIALFGFASDSEKSLFEALLDVAGVGPKVALAVLSGLPAGAAVRAIEEGDAARLRAVPGVGRKLAERIVLELREKVARLGIEPKEAAAPATLAGEARAAESALTNLGYAPAEARRAIERVSRAAAGP